MDIRRVRQWMLAAAVALLCTVQAQAQPTVVVAEGEKFTPQGDGWKVTHQDHSYASHTYGGMWVSNGGLLGADEKSVGAVATQTVTIPQAGQYRVWSKFQAPPYFSYAHTIEIEQGGNKVFSHTYGLPDAVKLWSFSAGEHKSIWWFWGVDHDAAEAPPQMIALQAGPATLKLISAKGPEPVGERFVDFVVLTTEAESTYRGYKPYSIASPFLYEAIEANKLYARFKNTGAAAAQLAANTAGHLQPQYGGQNGTYPEAPVAPGEWSPWFNIAGICRMMHDEGVWVRVPGATTVPMQFARDAQGSDIVGDLAVASGEAVIIPIDIAWNKDKKVRSSRDRAEELIALTKSGKWRSSNGGKKPQKLVYYGAFNGPDYVWRMKDALRYNTVLPDGYDKVRPDGYHQHTWTDNEIRTYAEQIKDKAGFRVLSFGDEISLGSIDFNDPAMQTAFTAWLVKKGITKADLGVEPAAAKLTPMSKDGNQRLMWYSARFNEEMRFTDFRARTELAKQLIGPHVLTGANYSPHHLAMCYGPIFQWVDIFKHNGMNMFWAEDYIFSVPEAPQIIAWMFAQTRSGVKYNKQPIHYYIMPHAPGQTAEFLRRNMVYAIGAGATQIDSFWVGPAEHYTENFVSWDYTDSFKAIYESILDSAVVEDIAVGGTQRATRVALITGKATDFNETRVTVPSSLDPFMSRSTNAPAEVQQIICRKDQQMLYLSLKHAQYNVDLITEDDIVEMDILKGYDVVYFAGEWVNHRAVPKIEQWIKDGGVFYATAGAGHLNEFNERDDSLAKVLGLKSLSAPQKNIYVIRTYLELPQAPTIGTITLDDGGSVQAIGMKQVLTPEDAKVIGKWEDGSAAVTVRELGKGKAFTVGTLAGNTYMKSGVRNVPWARGGYKNLYNPTEFDPAATKLAHLAIDASGIAHEAETSSPYVEAMLIDAAPGTLVTLVNWNNAPVDSLTVKVRVAFTPKSIRSVEQGKDIAFEYADGIATFTTKVTEADYVVISR